MSLSCHLSGFEIIIKSKSFITGVRMQLNLWYWLLALSPLALFLYLMIGKKLSGSKAGFLSWIYTVIISLVFFGSNLPLLGNAHYKALFLAGDVLLIIWMALLFFHISNYAGAVKVLGDSLAGLTSNKTMQVLLLSWMFTSFLQGLGGFGVPVAVAAPLLIGLGIPAIDAVVMASIGHGWAVTFGSMGSSFQTMMALSDYSGYLLAPDTAILLGSAAVLSGALIAYIYAGFRAVWKNILFILVNGIILGGVQYLLAVNGLWTVAATGAAMAALAFTFVVIQIRKRRATEASTTSAKQQINNPGKPSLLLSISVYLILVLLSFTVKLVAPINELLSKVKINHLFPEIISNLGWITPSEYSRTITIFTHPGSILLIASLIAYLLYSSKKIITRETSSKILHSVKKSGFKSSIAIFFTVSIAVIMSHTGMTHILAKGISNFVNAALYPAITPFIGALGAFISGSNNNSNILFTKLHMQTAQLMGLDVTLILAAQSAGGAIGSIFAPAKVIVGCSTVGLAGKEGSVLGKVIKYGIMIIVCIAILATLLSLLR